MLVGLAVRVGRQSPISGGLLGYFDSVSLSYPFRTGWKFDLMGGVPANPLVSAPAERLAAVTRGAMCNRRTRGIIPSSSPT